MRSAFSIVVVMLNGYLGFLTKTVALYLNRRLWRVTALNSWTGGLSIGFRFLGSFAVFWGSSN
jgi:hypothetical protein